MHTRDLVREGADRQNIGNILRRCRCMAGIREARGKNTNFSFEVGCFLILGHFLYQIGFPITEVAALVDFFSASIRFEKDKPDDGVILISPGELSGKKSTGVSEAMGRHLTTGERFPVHYPNTMLTYFVAVLPNHHPHFQQHRVKTTIDLAYIWEIATKAEG